MTPIGRENGSDNQPPAPRISEGRLSLPDDPRVDAHVEGSMLRDTCRGVRVDKRPGCNNDAVVALAMAVDRVEQKPAQPTRVIGWVA